MALYEPLGGCQMSSLRETVQGKQNVPRRRMKQLIRVYLGPRKIRVIEQFVSRIKNTVKKLRGRNSKFACLIAQSELNPLMSGDLVAVKPRAVIEATLDPFGRLKGCSFPTEMIQYCGTKQRVLKPVERFVDERDLKIRKTKGVFLLKDITCNGIGSFGRCDRNCYFFWREEWLEKIDEKGNSPL
jgi:hypothetical protein